MNVVDERENSMSALPSWDANPKHANVEDICQKLEDAPTDF